MKKVENKKAVIGATIDKARLKEAAEQYLNASAVYSAVKALSGFSWTKLPDFWRNIIALFEAVIASVEIAKAELLEGQPEGNKIDGALALSVAVDILDQAVTFTGAVGKLIEMIDGPILRLLVNIVLGKRHGVDWLGEAWDILGLNQKAAWKF